MRFANPRWWRVVAVAALVGCGSDGTTDPVDELDPNTIVARIDGVDWITTTAFTINANGRIVTTGNGTGGLTFGLGVTAQAPGTYTTGGTGAASGTLADGSNTVWEATSTGGSGTVTITSFSGNEVSGTFSFTLVRTLGSSSPASRAVANGRFRVRY